MGTGPMRTATVSALLAFLLGLGFELYGQEQRDVFIGGAAPPTAGAAAAPANPNPVFEVASVKPNRSGANNIGIGLQPGGRFTATNVPVVQLIRFAYGLQPFQIVGGPSWANSDRFDITAKAEGDVAPAPLGAGGPPGPMQLMVRALLADRFKLVVHTETREMPIYNLVLARPDGRLGDRLKPSTLDCAALTAARRGGGPGARAGGPPPALTPGERPQCGMRMGPGNLSAGGMTITFFGNGLGPMLQRVVTDKTNLAGTFDIDLTWTPDVPQGALNAPPTPGAPPGANAPPPIDPNGPTIFTAVQEQLGLKLEPARGPVDVLVIDSVQQPTPD